jgi:hypothetical protein
VENQNVRERSVEITAQRVYFIVLITKLQGGRWGIKLTQNIMGGGTYHGLSSYAVHAYFETGNF